jgi:hypothetical protein
VYRPESFDVVAELRGMSLIHRLAGAHLVDFRQAVRVYHPESFDLVAELRGHGGAVTAFLPLGGGRFLSG